MAFPDILQALRAETDAAIAAARAEHDRELEALRERSTLAKLDGVTAIERERDRKMQNMERQVLAHARMNGRQAAMAAKHALVERAYAEALAKLAALPPKQAEALLETLVGACPEGGTLRPAKAHEALVRKLAGGRAIGEPVDAVGGFVHESDAAERDCTFETLVRDVLRPATELEVANILFPAA